MAGHSISLTAAATKGQDKPDFSQLSKAWWIADLANQRAILKHDHCSLIIMVAVILTESKVKSKAQGPSLKGRMSNWKILKGLGNCWFSNDDYIQSCHMLEPKFKIIFSSPKMLKCGTCPPALVRLQYWTCTGVQKLGSAGDVLKDENKCMCRGAAPSHC